MKATEILMEEHRVIERVLDTIEKGVEKIENGQEIDPQFFIDVTDFVRGFADGCHHHKEEGVLFKTMEAHGVPNTGGPIGVMLAEHEQGRQFIRGLRDAAERWASGDQNVKAQVVQDALGYVALLRTHIQKEDTILFPMADQAIPQAKYALVEQGFEQIEHEETGEGVHEKYLALADRLAAQVRE
jgi:hemerythrin-like domain-containing protein